MFKKRVPLELSRLFFAVKYFLFAFQKIVKHSTLITVKPKTAIFIVISVILITAIRAAETPSIRARTDNQSKNKERSTTDTGWRQSQDVRNIGVAVDLSSFRAPKEAYDVQCFFVARSEANETNYIYDVQRQESTAQFDSLQFQAPPLDGSGSRWLSLPVKGFFVGGGSFRGTLTYTQRIAGSKFYGWLIRVVSQGLVVRIETNQAPLKELAEKNPSIFNEAVKNFTKSSVSPTEAELEAKFQQQVAESQAKKDRVYPEALDPTHPIHEEAERIWKNIEQSGHALLNDPDAPFTVYEMAANRLGIKPTGKP
jgi:hypothetical protein